MAHVHAYGDVCPKARPIIHLGATSCYVTDNTDLILLARGAGNGSRSAGRRDRQPGPFAQQYRALPCLAFTHFQPAQPTTVGKRACLWAYDFVLDLAEIEFRLANLKAHGSKGTTGTQASFLALVDGDHEKVRRLDELICRKIGFAESYAVTGQTYPRKIDSQILAVLSGISQSAHKMATDLRLLAHRKEIEEPHRQRADRIVGDGLQAEPHAVRADLLAGPFRDEPGEQRRGDRGRAMAGTHAWTTAPTGGSCCRSRSWPPTPC